MQVGKFLKNIKRTGQNRRVGGKIFSICETLGAEVELQTKQFRRHQKWALIQDMEFKGWTKIKNQHGYYLAVKRDNDPAVGGIITSLYIMTNLWSFQTGGTKLEIFLPKNQHTQRKLLNFENWVNGEVSKIGRHFRK